MTDIDDSNAPAPAAKRADVGPADPIDVVMDTLESFDQRLRDLEEQLPADGVPRVDPEALPGWIDWLIEAYQLEERIHTDWASIPGVHQELAALHAAWTGAYSKDGAPAVGFGPVQWHDALGRTLERVQRWTSDQDTRVNRYRAT